MCPSDYKPRRRPDSRLKITPSEKKLTKTPKKEGGNNAAPSASNKQ